MSAPVSIFNDVIGPVMRGPSSSHCAAALRIGRLARDIMDADIETVLVEYDTQGSLATTHASQGSDMGLWGGLMGWDTTDERLTHSEQAIREAGIRVNIETGDFHDPHPNTYRLTLSNQREKHQLVAVSTGGGMIRMISIDGIPVTIAGDFQETLIFLNGKSPNDIKDLIGQSKNTEILVHDAKNRQLLQVKADQFVNDRIITELRSSCDIHSIKQVNSVLPTRSRKEMKVPFCNYRQMLAYDAGRNLPLWELAMLYESQRGGISPQAVLAKMVEIVKTVRTSVAQGIDGTSYADRILGYQCGGFQERMEAGQLLDAGLMNNIILNVTALMEVKSAMGVIVAAPTAGSCAALPGACIAASDALKATDEDAARAMLAAGLIGVFIAEASTFAAEEAGCQAECGAASGMTAAALVTLAAGSTLQAIAAASMALQNSLGMICDPVANRVESPCLGKNTMAAVNALACANMALAGYDPVIPLDEVIETMDHVGRSIPRELRCTALGGLSITKTSKAIEQRLQKNTKQNKERIS